MGYSAAIVLAYLCGMVTAFVLAKRFVFAQSPLGTRTEFIRFGFVNLAAVVQVWAVSIALGDWLLPMIGVTHYAHDIAHIVGVAVPVFTSYLGHKHCSFAGR
jgi:putative flippase GtrA